MEKVAKFYRALQEEEVNEDLKALFSRCAEESQKASELIMRARREVVSEMGGLESTFEIAVEPIEGIDIDSYKARVDEVKKMEQKSTVEKALLMEEILSDMLRQLSSKLEPRFPKIKALLEEMLNWRTEHVIKKISSRS